MHFRAKPAYVGTGSSGRLRMQFGFIDPAGYLLAGWGLCGVNYRGICYSTDHSSAPYIGPSISWPDTNYHDFDLCWYKNTGLAEWYCDGALRGSYTYSAMAGRNASGVQWDSRLGYTDRVYFDDLQAGTYIPEPSSLLALGAMGLGAFGVVWRRRA